MKSKVLRKLSSMMVGAIALSASGLALTADQNQTNLNSSVTVKRALAWNIESDRVVRSGFRWNREETTGSSTVSVANMQVPGKPEVIWHSLNVAPESQSANAIADGATTYAVKGFRWGVKSGAEQQGFRWGVKSAAEQQGFRWGVKNTAEQKGFRWGVKSTAEQQGFRWGVKSTAEQQGFRWGVKSAAEQQGFRWGVKSAAEQQGFRWGVKNTAEQQGFRWGVK